MSVKRVSLSAPGALLCLESGWYVDEEAQLNDIYYDWHDGECESLGGRRSLGNELCDTMNGEPANVARYSHYRGDLISDTKSRHQHFNGISCGGSAVVPSSCEKLPGAPSAPRCPRFRPDARLWDIRTPFMMDQQAEKEAARLENGGEGKQEPSASQKRRDRRKKARAPAGRGKESEDHGTSDGVYEMEHVMASLSSLLEERCKCLGVALRSGSCGKTENDEGGGGLSVAFKAQADGCRSDVTNATPDKDNLASDYIRDSVGVISARGYGVNTGDVDRTSDDFPRPQSPGPTPADYRLNNRAAREAARHLLDNHPPPAPPFCGDNNSDRPRLVRIQNRDIVLPPHCRFLCGDVTAAFDDVTMAESLIAGGPRFDCMVVDPPWSNKFVRRKRKRHEHEGYQCLDTASLSRLPLRQLMSPGALVAVWCTNSESHMATLREVLLPIWGVQEVVTWYWVKVTRFGVPVTCGPHHSKRPYESLVLGRVKGAPADLPPLPPDQLIVSVPCTVHSRKPLLNDLLQPFLPANYRGLEVFARGLLPGWTSWGDQVLLLQQVGTLLLTADSSC